MARLFTCTPNTSLSLQSMIQGHEWAWTCQVMASVTQVRCLVEPMILGEYEKFNSNSGWVSDQSALTEVLSHFSYHHTGGQFLLCDLQGNVDATRYLLTDPAVHSYDGDYGPTDGGLEAMKSFFSRHACNRFCESGWIRAAAFEPPRATHPMRMGNYFFFLQTVIF